MKLSILIPVYNEERTVSELLQRVEKAATGAYIKEIIVINDGSTDRTKDILRSLMSPLITAIHIETNAGKGAAIREGLKHTTGDIVLIQDGDLEYNPEEYVTLLKPFVDKNIKVVYGSRYMGADKHHRPWGTGFITEVTNMLYGGKLTDEPTCYKVFSRELLQSLPLSSDRFEICPELTAKVMKRKIEIIEVPISYTRRSKSEGKKLSWFKDGFAALFALIKYRFID